MENPSKAPNPSVVGVVLAFTTLNQEEMVDFFVYHSKQRKFSHLVKILRTKFFFLFCWQTASVFSIHRFPDSCQLGGWFRLLFADDFDVVEHFRYLKPIENSDLPVVVPKRAVICQRRLTTRIQDERIMVR